MCVRPQFTGTPANSSDGSYNSPPLRRLPTLLLKVNTDTRQISTTFPLIRRHSLHASLVRLEHEPLVSVLAPRLPHRRPRQTVRVRVERPDEARPIPLGDGHNGRVCGRVTGRRAAVDVLRAPDGVGLDRVCDAST